MQTRYKARSGGAYFLGAVLGSIGTLGLCSCGGATRDVSGRGSGHGNPNAGATADGGNIGGSGHNGGGGGSAGAGSNGMPNDGGGTPSPGGAGSSGDGGTSSGSGGTSSSAGGEADDVSVDPGVPPVDLPEILGELDALHMDQDLASIVKEQCTATLSLGWDFARDETIDATETRIFDPGGRLVAAEIASAPAEGAKVRKRVRITYDAKGRPTQYLYGVDGDGFLDQWISRCDPTVPGLPRGTVVDVAYANDGSSSVRMGSTEYCQAYCETLAFAPGDRFLGRHRKCARDVADFRFQSPNWDQVRKLDSQGRRSLDRVNPLPHDVSWSSDIRYTYPAADTTVVTWGGDGTYDRSYVEKLGPDGRIMRTEFHIMYDLDMGDVVTDEYDADGCGVVESTDWWNDGVADIVDTTRCTAGRVTHQEERNMTSIQEAGEGPSLRALDTHRAVTPFLVAPQTDAAADYSYDTSGRLFERKFEVTTVVSDPYLPRSQHDVFSYDGATSTGTFDRKGPSLSWDGSSRDGVKVLGIPPESSATLCTVATTCKAMPPIDSALSLCAPGVGINSWPAPYSRVPGLLPRPVDTPWDAVPAGFLGDPVLRQVIGY